MKFFGPWHPLFRGSVKESDPIGIEIGARCSKMCIGEWSQNSNSTCWLSVTFHPTHERDRFVIDGRIQSVNQMPTRPNTQLLLFSATMLVGRNSGKKLCHYRQMLCIKDQIKRLISWPMMKWLTESCASDWWILAEIVFFFPVYGNFHW